MDWRERFDKVAQHLSRRACLVRFREPPTKGAAGECYRAEDFPSVAFIDISPGLCVVERFKVLLHEVAHARLHLETIETTSAQKEHSGSIELSSHFWNVQHAEDSREHQAQALADRWNEYAETKVFKAVGTCEDEELLVALKLVALEFYKETET